MVKKSPQRVKIALIGDGNVGKTSICFRLVNNEFSQIYVPTVFESNPFLMNVEGAEYNLVIFDTAGQEDYKEIRKSMVYPLDIDVFLVCYSIDDNQSYENVKEHWSKELKENASGKPIILVATKGDLRKTKDTSKLKSNIDGMEMQHDIGAQRFFECSAKDPTKKNTINIIFKFAISCYVDACRNSENNTNCCEIM
jgi:small GTP-binding protein